MLSGQAAERRNETQGWVLAFEGIAALLAARGRSSWGHSRSSPQLLQPVTTAAYSRSDMFSTSHTIDLAWGIEPHHTIACRQKQNDVAPQPLRAAHRLVLCGRSVLCAATAVAWRSTALACSPTIPHCSKLATSACLHSRAHACARKAGGAEGAAAYHRAFELLRQTDRAREGRGRRRRQGLPGVALPDTRPTKNKQHR